MTDLVKKIYTNENYKRKRNKNKIDVVKWLFNFFLKDREIL
jgi:hypothetical protein